MPTLKRPLSPIVAAAFSAISVGAHGAGFGTSTSATPLGQPLEFAVPVRIEPGEVLTPECVAAEVTLGDRRLPAGAVRTALDTVNAELLRLRVTTLVAVDEPVVNVSVSLGCPPRLARNYVVFGEPPLVAPPPAVAPVAAAPVLPGSDPARAAAGNGALAAAPAASAASAPAAEPAVGSVAPPSAPAVSAAASRPGAGQRAVLRAVAPGNTAAVRPPRPPAAAAPAAVARRAPVQPRLRLEAAEPPPRPAPPEAIAQAMEAVAQAASAARAAEAAASAAAGRIAALERTVEQLRSEARSAQEQAGQLRQRLSASEETSRWMLPLAAAVLVLGALAGWLGWRVTSLQRERRADWRVPAPTPATGAAATQPADSTQGNSPTTSFATLPAVGSAPAGARWHRGTPAWPPPAAAATVNPWVDSDLPSDELPPEKPSEVTRTQPLPPRSGLDEGTPRDVTIEELIDLEQQAEFFVVLGQDEAAVDLLMEHLRSTGGGSPLPYLKLLEIYRRRGDREAYERTRTRFNHRFNAYAPEWGADLAAGRTLEDYPGVVPRLQQVWPRPLDAMAELEALLFRKARGELFDLPAYREVLLLYSLARDLLDRKAAEAGDVDFLLPMNSEGATTEFGATAPVPYLGLETDRAPLHGDEPTRPTKPLDFDVTRSPNARPSLFGDLDPPTSPGHRRN
jgi:hypothetical protein